MIPELIDELLPAGRRTRLAGNDYAAQGTQERHAGYCLA